MTNIGFSHLFNSMAKFGIKQDENRFRYGSMIPILTSIKKILGQDINFNEYDEFLMPATTELDSEGIKKLNDAIALLLPVINTDHTADIYAAANKSYVNPESVKKR